MASDNGSDWAVQLPSYGITPAQADIYQNENARKDAAAKAAVKPVKMGVAPILAADAAKDADITKYVQGVIANKQAELSALTRAGASTEELKNKASTTMGEISPWIAATKAKEDEIEKGLAEQAKIIGNGFNIERARKNAHKLFYNDIFDKDQNGNLVHKPYQNINFNRDYVNESMADPMSVKDWYDGSGEFDKHLATLKPTVIDEKTNIRNAKGELVSDLVKGNISPLRKVIRNANGHITGEEVIGETIPNALASDGKSPLVVLDKQNFDGLMSNPAVRADFDRKFVDVLPDMLGKDPKTGKNIDLSSMTPAEQKHFLDTKKREFAYNYINSNGVNGAGHRDGSILNFSKSDLQPITKNNTYVSVNTGEGSKNFVPFTNHISQSAQMSDPLAILNNGKNSMRNLEDEDATINGLLKTKGKNIGTSWIFPNSKMNAEQQNIQSQSLNKTFSLLGLNLNDFKRIKDNPDKYADFLANKMNEQNKIAGETTVITPQDLKNSGIKNVTQIISQPARDSDGNYIDNKGQTIEDSKDKIPPDNVKMVKKSITKWLTPNSTSFKTEINDAVADVQAASKDVKAFSTNYGKTGGIATVVEPSAQFKGQQVQPKAVPQASTPTKKVIKGF